MCKPASAASASVPVAVTDVANSDIPVVETYSPSSSNISPTPDACKPEDVKGKSLQDHSEIELHLTHERKAGTKHMSGLDNNPPSRGMFLKAVPATANPSVGKGNHGP